MGKIIVVYHEKTKEIVPFKLGPMGTIILLTTSTRFSEDMLRVKIVDACDVNFETGYLEEKMNGKQKASD